MENFDCEQYKKKCMIIVISCFIVMLLVLFSVSMVIVIKDSRSKDEPIVVVELDNSFSMQSHVPTGSKIMNEEEFYSAKGTMIFETYDEYVSSVQSQFSSTTPTITATGVNLDLFNYCDQYFKVYYGQTRVSPIFPMALANVETNGRADYDVAWTALFPTRIVPIEKLDTFNVTDVLADEATFSALSREYSTRDRGCLQMSPTYGTGNKYLNSLMSGTEKEKLSGVATSHSSWVSGASSCPGDRFYLPDVLMRLQAAMEGNVLNFATKAYAPTTDNQLIAMLAVTHNSGSNVFAYGDHSRATGRWVSGDKAFQWCKRVSSMDMTLKLQEYAKSSSTMYITQSKALELYKSVYNDSYSDYCSNTTNAAYPIQVLYSYFKLIDLYTQ